MKIFFIFFRLQTLSRIDQWKATANLAGEIGRLSLHVAAYEKLWLSTIENQTAIPSIHCFHTVSQALAWIDESKAPKSSVLVTGSLYLVGALLKLLDKHDGDK
jgi:folylpolyglutamate synthase/dihydropteroate synthase